MIPLGTFCAMMYLPIYADFRAGCITHTSRNGGCDHHHHYYGYYYCMRTLGRDASLIRIETVSVMGVKCNYQPNLLDILSGDY